MSHEWTGPRARLLERLVAGVLAAGLPAAALAAPPNSDVWSARKLIGPIASVEEWCRQRPASDPCLGGGDAGSAQASPASLNAPLLGGRWVVTGNAEEKTARLALQTAAGWFVSPPVADPGLSVRPVELSSSASAPKLVTARVVTTWNATSDPGGNARWQLHCQENLLVCGVGASGAPSCTPAIPARDGECDDPDKPVEWSYSLGVKVDPQGLEIAAPKAARLPGSARRAVGKHRLLLP